MPIVASILAWLEQFAPLETAASWDNVGLLLGDANQDVQRVMTCLTVTPESAKEAIDERANLIVSHHPILFKPIQRLTTNTAEGRMLLDLTRAGLAVYCPHTAFDNAIDGINALLARVLGLERVRPLISGSGRAQLKIVVFVPDKDLNKVMDAMFDAGAGHIGQYRECSYFLAGRGTFYGTEATNPAIGQKGQREEVSEWRLELVCPQRDLEHVLAAMRKAHSYEEPAYDVYPLKPAPNALEGEGRLGSFPAPISLEQLSRDVRERLHCGPVQTVGDPDKPITRLAIAGGAGGSFLSQAVRAQADALLTGEARFHDYLAARAQGIALILPGHYATERPGVEHLALRIWQQFPEIHAWASRAEQDPVRWV